MRPYRTFDRSRDGFNKWEFMTTHHWGENPMGTWILEIEDQGFKRIVFVICFFFIPKKA